MAEPPYPSLPRLRQAVLAARDLDAVAGELSERLKLGEPFADPGVAHFGLRNAVFALGDTFLEVVSPVQENTAAGRLIERRGGDCGYMLMFQVDDLAGARERVDGLGVREVFEVDIEDMSEVHLHPADMRGAIVSLSQPVPHGSWRWGGPDWQSRSAPPALAGATIAVAEPGETEERWSTAMGGAPGDAGILFTPDEEDRGLVEIVLAGPPITAFELAGVRFTPSDYEEE
ncbi:MAG: VOC family protein [Solirubrobacteraceae bacterium]